MKNLQTIAGPLAERPRLESVLRWTLSAVVAVALAILVLAATGNSALALQGGAVNGGSADLQGGIMEGQALTVGLIGLGAGIAALLLLIRKNYAGTLLVVIVAAFAIVFASDPTGTVTTGVAAAIELLTGQG